MRALGWSGIATWAVLTLGSLSYPGTTYAQLRGGFGQRGVSNPPMVPGFGGPRGNVEMPLPGPLPFMGGMERQSQGRLFQQREFDAPNGQRRPANNVNPAGLNPG